MGEPRIQYAKTTDGVSIAYWTLGEGPGLVWMPWLPGTHLQFEWQIPGMKRMYEGASRGVTLVRYDSRGFGLSDRGVTDFSVEAMLRDLEAVVDRPSLRRFRLLAAGVLAPVAIAYAARHPERLSHLVLWHGSAQGSDIWSEPFISLTTLSGQDYVTTSEAWMRALYGWSREGYEPEWAELMRECVTPDALLSLVQQSQDWDVRGLLPSLATPTLVGHHRQFRYLSVDVARRLAAAIPEARLCLHEGSTFAPGAGSEAFAAIARFLAEGEEAATPAELPEGMAVLLFADIAQSTALTEQLGDAAFRAKARELDTSLRSVISESGGTPVEGKLVGDGVLAVFTSARGAIKCALRREAAGDPLGLKLHLGIHAGDVIREGSNVYGGAVNIAARIAAASQPGEVLVSQTVRDLARTSAGVTFDDRGQRKLKGVEGRQRLFAVGGEADG
jgi:class 3 adenylate cyclase